MALLASGDGFFKPARMIWALASEEVPHLKKVWYMNHQKLGVGAQEHSRTIRNNEPTQEGYSYKKCVRILCYVENIEIDAY